MDDDFTGFAAARWRPLLRAAVVLGCSPTEAEDLVQTTLLRCYVAWPKVVRAESRDAYAGRVLLNAFRESRRRRWWGERPAAEPPDALSDDGTGRVDDADAARRLLAGLSPDPLKIGVASVTRRVRWQGAVATTYWCSIERRQRRQRALMVARSRRGSVDQGSARPTARSWCCATTSD